MKLSLASLLCVIALYSRATTYYVSNAGSDAANGTSTGTPWRTLANVWTNRASIVAGDSVLFKAGDTFDGPFRLSNSGSSGSTITIDRYGSGANPVIYGDHPSAVWAAVPGHSGIFVTLAGPPVYSNPDTYYASNGAKFTRFPRGVDTLDNWLNTFTNSVWGFDSVVNVYVKTPDGNPPSQAHIFEFTTGWASDYFIMQNLMVRNSDHGIYVQGVGAKIRTNIFHDIYGSGVYCNDASHVEVVGNTIANTAYTMIYLVHGGTNWVHANMLATNSSVILGNVTLPAGDRSGIGLLGGTNNIVEHNSISYMVQAFVDYFYEANSEIRYNSGFHAATASSPTGTGIKEHHNIWNLDLAGRGITCAHATNNITDSPLGDTGPNVIYNNVVYNFTGYGFFTAGSSATGVIIRDNIFQTTSLNAIDELVDLGPGTDTDYNLFYQTQFGATQRFKWNSVQYSSFASYQAASGQDAHSLCIDASFLVTTPVLPGEFQLSAASQAIRAGVNMKQVGLLAADVEYKDFNGKNIPSTGPVSMGAFQYGDVTILTTTITKLIIQ